MNPKSLALKIFRMWIFTCLALTLAGYAFAGTDQDAEKYKKMLASESIKVRTDAAKYIVRYKVEDPALFETMKDRLAQGYNQRQSNRYHMDEMAWYCKALAISGNDAAYGDLLRKVARETSNKNLERHCGNSAKQIAVYSNMNKAAETQASGNRTLSEEEIQLIAMLRSKDPVTMRNAAKKVYRHPLENDAVTDVMGEELLKASIDTGGDRYLIDALAWMCKALGASGKDKYRDTLQQVIEKASSDKVKKYAKQGMSLL